MIRKLKDYSLTVYLEELSKKHPTPGGGSAAAYMAAMGVALLEMVTHYSVGKDGGVLVERKLSTMLEKIVVLRKRFLELVDLDAQAYQGVVAAKRFSEEEKKKADQVAKNVPKEVAKLCYDAIQFASYLVEKGNKNLIGDIEIAVEMLAAGFNSAKALMKK